MRLSPVRPGSEPERAVCALRATEEALSAPAAGSDRPDQCRGSTDRAGLPAANTWAGGSGSAESHNVRSDPWFRSSFKLDWNRMTGTNAHRLLSDAESKYRRVGFAQPMPPTPTAPGATRSARGTPTAADAAVSGTTSRSHRGLVQAECVRPLRHARQRLAVGGGLLRRRRVRSSASMKDLSILTLSKGNFVR
jgi:hypothetical protein